MNLREEIEIFLKETYQSGNCMPREHIAARRLLQMFEKRIDIRIEELKKGLNDKYWKNILGKEKWARYSKSLQDLIDELEMLKMGEIEMTTLREESLKKEIQNQLIKRFAIMEFRTNHTYADVANEILSIIEKRIDLIYKSEDFNTHNSTSYEDGFTNAIMRMVFLLQ